MKEREDGEEEKGGQWRGRGVMSTYMKVANGGINEAYSIDGFPRTGTGVRL